MQFFTNRLVLVGIAVELVLLNLLIYVPFLHELFHTGPIGLQCYGITGDARVHLAQSMDAWRKMDLDSNLNKTHTKND